LAWHALTLPAQRATLAAVVDVVDVTVMPGRRGPQFDAASIVLDFKAWRPETATAPWRFDHRNCC
jgi:hypothetical protein